MRKQGSGVYYEKNSTIEEEILVRKTCRSYMGLQDYVDKH
jgi:hypothetical protein